MNDQPDAGKDLIIPAAGEHHRNGAAHSNAAELLPLLETVLRRWPWLFIGGATLGALGFIAGPNLWKSSYTAPAQLMRYESPNAVEVFGVRQAAPQTLPSILRSPELLQRVGAKASPPISADVLAGDLRVMPEHDSDVIVVAVTGPNRSETVELANLFASEAVRYTQEMQAKAAGEIIQFTTRQLERADSEIAAVNRQESYLPPATLAAIAPPTSALSEKIQAARADLAGLVARYMDAHPLVRAKRAEITALEKELPPPVLTGVATNTAATNAAAFASSDPEVIRGKLTALETARLALIGRKQQAESFAANPPGYCQLLALATEKDLVKHGRDAKILFLAAFMGMLGFVGSVAVILLIEIADDRLKSPADVRRVARLPVLATAGDFARMNSAQKENWAFRTWTNLQGRLSASPNHGLVCGFTSADHGEGRSIWVNQLARAANQLGFRVLTIATQPTRTTVKADVSAGKNGPGNNSITFSANGNGSNGYAKVVCPHCELHIEYPKDTQQNSFPCPECSQPVSIPKHEEMMLQQNVLASPGEVAQKLMGPEPQPIVHIPLPGWVWNLERRKQWQAALQDWSQLENVVILVELPPASKPEAVLLAQNLPNLVWLAASGKSRAGETREQLETLRHARCHLAGAVLNRAANSALQNKFRRWVNYAVIFSALNLSVLRAAELAELPAAANQGGVTNLSFSVASPAQRAPWQRHLTLGAGDVLNFSLYGEPMLAQAGVPVGPDGRVSFLEAQDVQAAGLTVDELRAKLDEELAKYRRAPRSIITPAAFNSKKYFLLGSVEQKGVFTLDRPITIVEAIARARGLETRVQERNLVEIADLQRAFLVRRGARLAVDFEKLFLHGDLSQNVPLEPDDYLYIPPADVKQIYVVGEVLAPGIAAFAPEASALRAITERGGFTTRAWKKKILVIRGSFGYPRTFEVDADAVLSARAADFKLEPDDIVYVHYRPWIRAEELLDLAATAFAQSAVIYWTGIHVGPIIKSPIIR